LEKPPAVSRLNPTLKKIVSFTAENQALPDSMMASFLSVSSTNQWDAVGNTWNDPGSAVSGIWDQIVKTVSNAGSVIGKVVGAVVSTISNAISSWL
jgi:phage-related protein